MNFLTRIVRFLFWLLFVSWSVWLLRRLVGWLLRDVAAKASPSAGAPPAARRLVRDPVCGTFVDETLSIPFREEGELLHFCSPACRDAYAVNVKKLAAHG
jgi:YHS domain-containing protein